MSSARSLDACLCIQLFLARLARVAGLFQPLWRHFGRQTHLSLQRHDALPGHRMNPLAEGYGRVVVATSADIKAHWEPLIGEVDIGSQDTGLARGFFDPKTNTVFLIADHIEAGQEMAVAAHELVHKHGKAVLGEARWWQLHAVIGSWANKPEGSLERRVYDEATARVKTSRPKDADAAVYSSEELFPYAVEVAMELGVQPTALMPNNSVRGWLVRVRAAMREAWDRLTNKPELFDSQDLVGLAFAVAQRENPAYASEF